MIAKKIWTGFFNGMTYFKALPLAPPKKSQALDETSVFSEQLFGLDITIVARSTKYWLSPHQSEIGKYFR